MKNFLKLFITSIVAMLVVFESGAQVAKFQDKAVRRKNVETINWSESVKELKYDGSSRTYMMFDGAVYLDDTSVPHVVRNIKVSGRNSLKASLTQTRFEPISTEELKAIKTFAIDAEIQVHTSPYTVRKESFVRVAFVPLRKNSLTGQIEKLVEFKLNTQEIPGSILKSGGGSTFVQSSVLASGSWFKVGVSNSGLHKISYEDLKSMGMNVDAIDPGRLNVFGNGGGMLPQPNDAFRHDDLQKNSIEVVGGNDGSFDPGDYILFYAKGPHRWIQDSLSCGFFRHEFNVYSDKSYYFVSADSGPGKRVSSIPSSAGQITHTVNKFVDYAFHESDQYNILKSGREWFGEQFDIQTSYDFDFGFSNVTNDPGYISARVISGASLQASYSIKVNGNNVVASSAIQGAPGGYGANARAAQACESVQFGSGNTKVSVTYFKPNPTAVGWLDYIEVILTRSLSMAGTQMSFRTLESVGSGNITEFQVGNANSALRVWEVTDPTNVSQRMLNLQGATATFKVETDSLREFVAFNGGGFYGVEPIGRVANQNLHASEQQDMIIVCHPDFLTEAERLANFHRQNETNSLTVLIATPEQIYNEFSSGAQDVTAIRDFMRMFYDRAESNWQEMPRYLLLFGDASYDYKDRVADNTNFVPTYESLESMTPTISYASDDYFGLLDANEGRWASSSNDALDIGIGRFVVRTLEDARVVVDKIYGYEDLDIADPTVEHLCGDGTSIATSPDWRNRIVFIADDEDNNMHINQADQLSEVVDTMYPEYNVSKVYFDAYVQESTPGGQRYPEANLAFNDAVNRGHLIVNYTGHGGELGLSHERVLGISDINSWTNTSNLAVFVTATCEFTRYDDPSRISAGELVHLNPNGGGIALFTTSRLVYSAPNFTLNKNFYFNLLKEQEWGPPTMGDVIRMTKVASGSAVNNRNFLLVGDPAQRLSFPLHGVETLTINGDNVGSFTDTINALQLVTVTGRMRDRNGQLMDWFSGVVYPTVFDKATVVSTLANDPSSNVRQFRTQKNLIYKGKASVDSGKFSFSFVVPKDIAYNYDFGRISYYAEGNGTNGNGYFDGFIIGGSNDQAITDDSGPTIGLYMNDEDFAFGGTTDENPSMLAIVVDSNGINTVGNGIGHDITAVLDDNTNQTISLNDFYQADLDSYRSGRVVYPFSGLSEGTHNLRFKVWDVYNNSSEAYTEFVVAESAELALEHVLNYPNPFTTRTDFMFEHNQPCNSLDVQVQVFTVSGKLVKTINETVLSHGFRNEPIAWDGLDDYGQKIGRGVYLYNLKVSTPDGQTAEQIERLVILN